jgi:hypothetical protein
LLKSNTSILNQRELELNTRESEINQLANNYRQMLGARFYQMNITSKDKNSSYSYYFNKIDNINSLKIISYSMPQPRYNIDMNNNIIKYNEKEVILNKGQYSISQLIDYLNRITELEFELTISQNIKISSKSKFELERNNLITSTLGIKETDVVKEEDGLFILEGSGTWDLRLHNKLFLYLTNINNEPISIIYLNGSSESTIQFEEPIELSQLDIELKDVNGNLYDFNGLDHSINLQLELVNQFNEISPEQTI